MDFRLFLILLVNIGLISAGEWSDTVFTMPDGFPCGDEKKCSNWKYSPEILLNTAYIKFKEELEEPILITYLHCTGCSSENESPQIGAFEKGSRTTLGPEIKKVSEGNYSLTIKNKLDYETPDQIKFEFYILLGGAKKRAKVTIDLLDIDDNPPIVTVHHTPCIIEENFYGETDCTFSIKDPDTIHTVDTVHLSVPHEYEEHFEVTLKKIIDKNNAIAVLNVREENPLDFEKMPMYFFELIAEDLGENNGTSFVTITVKDVNDQPPRWIDIFAMKSFNEKSEQEFNVSAKDGDLGINDRIIYKWKDDKCHEDITLSPIDDKAKIKINPINRDTQEMEDNDNTIKCTLIAFEESSDKYNTSTEISFIIQDINDNEPLITLDPKYEPLIKLREEEYTTLDKIFRIDDIDQGNNAQFDVTLKNTADATIKIDYTEPFQVIPNNGYKKWVFAISVIDKDLLDYDKSEDWRKFSLTIHSEDKGDEPMADKKTINIELINLNDEVPEFDKETNYIVDIKEDAKKGAYILNVLATDADEDDYITYDISEKTDYELVNQKNKSVTIYTIADNVFDYEKVKVVYIQIYAKDNLIIPGEENIPHTVPQQIQINVQDVNDEKPIINLPYETNPIDEHSDINTEVTSKISAKDVDTTAHLNFTINWENSKASKSGVQKTNTTLFKDVFCIETIYPDDKKKGQAVGILKVKNNETLDYEEFDTIFLNIKVTDIDQPEPGNTDEGTLTISIADINDNAPEFKQETIESLKEVEEHSKSLFRIAQIVAFDIDGPGNNDITYKLEPRNKTEPGLVKIDPKTGDLIVDSSEKIDADYPDPIEYLYYTVTASDNVHNTARDIEIYVEDINDKIPFLKKKLDDDSIKERKSTDEKECLKQKIQGHDDDRDDPHNKVKYYINNEINPQLSQMFEIHPDKGEVCARGDIEWKSNQKDIKVYIILEDNYKGSGVPNTHKVNFTVKIIDIDNNPPVLPDETTYTVMENIKMNEEIAKFIATDEDEPCTKTTEIEYNIEEVKHNRGKDISADFFLLSKEEGPPPKCEQIATLKVVKSLQDYYGKITVTIRAQNVENKDNEDKKSYEINVKPYNYKPPVIRIPNKPTLILKKEQEVNKQLKYVDGRSVEDFEADDDQGGKFEMSFKQGEIWDSNFKLLFPNPDGEKNKARLILTNTDLDANEYTLQIIAYHAGEGNKNDVDKTITIKFVDTDQLPGFIDIDDKVEFWENSTEPDNECKPFKAAHDPKCIPNEECEIFYHIVNVEEKRYFRTEKGTPPNLCLNVALDREEQAKHSLIIVATNNEQAPSKVPEDYTPLNLTVIVKDINDNPPAFESKLFKGGLSDTQKIDSVIVTLKASDPDEVDIGKLTYKIEEITVSDQTLTSVKDKAFKLEKDEIKNLIQPTQVMKGYFLFKVRVFDSFETVQHSDTAEVKIHIISDANRVIFEFSDDIDAVKLKEEEMREIFSKQFGYTCVIDDISKIENETTTRETTYITQVKTHFIDESIDEPVDKEVITTKLEDLAIIGKLQTRLEDINLTLISIENNENEITNEMEDMNYLLKILLIVVSVVLGTLCIILIIAFILRSRSLNKRLEAMTTNVFGSTKSDLNRIGTSAPGANRHAIEANPIWNEDLNNVNQFDTISQDSGGSDLIGIEDKPDFAYDFRRASINPIIQQNLHNMSQQDDDMNSFPGFNNNNNGTDNKTYAEHDYRRASINPVIQQNLHNMSEQDDDDDIRSLPGSNNERARF